MARPRSAARGRAGAVSEGTGGESAAEDVLDGRWLLLGKDMRLTAYARAEGGLVRWTECRPGGPDWRGPEFIAAPGVDAISLAQGANGYVHFFGRRAGGGGRGSALEIVHAIQYQTGRPLTEWTSVGNPYKDPGQAALVGAPVGAVTASGTVHVFVRNAGGGVMMRREGDRGAWLPWRDIRGNKAKDGLAATALGSGRIELLAPGDGPAMHWCQTQSDGDMERRPNIHIAPARNSVVAVETGPDRVTFFWTDLVTGTVHAHRPGGWVIPMGASPAEGRPAALRAVIDGYDCTVLAHRATDGDVMVAACATENEQAGVWWSPTGESSAHQPALAHDGQGRLVLAVIGARGELRIARQGVGPGLVLEPTHAV
ncbi:hypothetical protein [Streptomyces sp. NPDC003393]